MLYTLKNNLCIAFGLPRWHSGKTNCLAMQETQEMGQEDPLGIHSSIHAWKIQRTEEPGGLQSRGLQKCWTWLSAGSQHGESHPWQRSWGRGLMGKGEIRTQGTPWTCSSIYPRTRICLSYYFMSFTSSSDISRGLSLTKRVNLGL